LPLQIEENNFYHYLRFGSFHRGLTPYKNVTELSLGSFLVIDCNSLKIEETRWWSINDFYSAPNSDSFDEALQQIDKHLNSSVKRRLESSDVEVGSFLSGGIDSSLITAIATKYNNKLKTFTISFDDQYDEAPLAKILVDKYQTQHTEIKISMSHIEDDVEEIISNYGEPFFDSSAIASYYVSREARKYLTVILNGDGADELFGGYRRYVPFAQADFFKHGRHVKNGASLIKKILPVSHDKNSKYNYVYRLASLASKSDIELYLSAGMDIFEDYQQYILAPDCGYMHPIKKNFHSIVNSNLSGLKKIMNLDFDIHLFDDLLVKMDIATMAHSIEGRSPFLSKELLEYAPSLNDKYKVNGRTTKYLLRQLGKKYLPAQLLDQPKRGFEVPLKKWVNGSLKDMVFDYVAAPNALNRNYIDSGFTQKLLANDIKIPQEKRAKIIWALLCMEIWYKKIYLH
jgi:asparagine synthase (glutamine-hydrolysing)